MIPFVAPRRRLWFEWALLAAALSLGVTLATAQGWFERLDAAIYDQALRLWARPAAADIVVVGVDEASLEQLGRWPWRRSTHAALLSHLAVARSVLLNFVLADEGSREPGDDDALASAIARHGRVVLPVHASADVNGAVAATLPTEPLRRAAAALGHIQADGDADGRIRGTYLFAGPPGAPWPHVAIALLDVAGEPRERAATSMPSAHRPIGAAVGGGDAAWSRERPALIAYVGGAGSFAYASYVSVLRGEIPEDFFRGRHVLVAAAAAGMGDLHPTPAAREGGLMLGAEIIANVLQQVREGIDLRVASPRAVLAATLAIVLVTLFVSVFLSAGARLLLTLAIVLALLGGAALALRAGQLWWPPATAVIALLLAFPLWSWRRLAAAEAFVDAELRQLDSVLPRSAPAIARVGDPLEGRIHAVQRAREEIRRRATEREEMLSFLTHDLRAPQASIIALVDLHRGGGAALDDTFWDRLTAYAKRTLSLSEDFVQIARAEYLGSDGLEPVDLGEAARDAVDDAWTSAQAKGMALESDLPANAWALGDRALLTRAIRNLLDNAVKHGPPGTAISVAVRRVGNRWHCSVADCGPGVALEERAAIFDRFHTAGSAQRRLAGAGLGLALVKAVAERCRGHAGVEEAPSGGARFTVAIPVLESAP